MHIQDPDEIEFNLVKWLKGSSIEYHRGTVYNLADMFPDTRFDLVVFKGVYYHLKDPIGALEAIADVMKPDGRMIIAGECLISYAADLEGNIIDEKRCRELAEMDVPLTVCYPGKIKGVASSTWFVPNVACIRSWLDATGWQLDRYTLHDAPEAKPRPGQRFLGVTTRKETARPVEHPAFAWGPKSNS